MPDLSVTLLVDSQSAQPDLLTEHGLSFLIRRGADTVLYDTGASGAWAANARKLGLPPDGIQHLVLSHGHRDHTGGIPEALQASPQVRIYMHPRTLIPRFSLHPGMEPRPLGLPSASWKALTPYSDAIRWTTAPMRVAQDMGLTGPILRRHPQEARSGPFFMDPEGREEDALEDDQALWIRTSEGLVIILGCAHAGVVNTLDHIREITGETRIRALIGGFHLVKADQTRLDFTAQVLRRTGIREILTCHCTGEPVAQELSLQWMRAGESWNFS